MGLSTVGDISKLQAQFASIKDEIDKRRKHAEFVKKKYSKISRNKNKK